jgi:Tfp pilus assembly PilM family ATPase
VDLGTAAVKLAQVERAGTAWRLAQARVVRRPPSEGAGHPGDDVLDWWDQACRSEPLRSGFSGNRAACVLPTARADLRAVNLPDGSEPERRAMIANELDALLGETASRRVHDFWDICPPGESNLENVNVISLPEDEAAAVVASLGRAGLRCRVIDGLPLAMARAVAMANGEDGAAPVAALDWGFTSATFSILCNHRPVFTRHLRDCGYGAMPAAVSEALGLSPDDAEQLLVTYGVCGPGATQEALRDVQEVIADVTSGLLNEIVSQLNRTLAYPELHRSGLVPVKIWLLGGGATVKNMAALLSARINVPVQTWHLSGGGAEGGPDPVLPAMLGPAIALSALAFE